MSFFYLHLLNKKNKNVVLSLFVISFYFISACWSSESISPATQQACKKFQKINHEIKHYGNLLGEKLLLSSYFQDAWLHFLHEAESVEEYHKGMQLIKTHTEGFHNICHYITHFFNFYTCDYQIPNPQLAQVQFEGKWVPAFLNTFKAGRNLNSSEREIFYSIEKSHYTELPKAAPFVLDSSTIHTLREEIVYNFVLLPDNTIKAALEEPNGSEYPLFNDPLNIDAFHYPNHTILAGSPHQAVISAGSFILYRIQEKELFFTSCKSGHFQPFYESLAYFNQQLAAFGVDPATIISMPHIDISQVLLKKYTHTQIPLSITEQEAHNLLYLANSQWKKVYKKINKKLLQKLSQVNVEVLKSSKIPILIRQAEKAIHFCNAFGLFSKSHTSPEIIHQLAHHFDCLKTSLKQHDLPTIQSEAALVLNKIEAYETNKKDFMPEVSDDESFFLHITHLLSSIEKLIADRQPSSEELNELKKKTREFASLFFYLAQDHKWKGKGYFLYRNAAKLFFKISQKISNIQDSSAPLEIPCKIFDDLKKILCQIAPLPCHYVIEVNPAAAWCMINSAKDWYLSHAYLLVKHCDSKEDPILYSLFLNIAKGNIPKKILTEELEQLKCLKRDAEVARNALIFLDVHHQAPEDIHHYIKNIGCIIRAIEQGHLEKVKKEAHFMIKCRHAPSLALEKWVCTPPESFVDTLNHYLFSLSPFLNHTLISKKVAEESIEKIQAIQDLMNLFRRNGARNVHLPMVCYDSLEEHAELLIQELQAALSNAKEEQTKVSITPSMTNHANFMLSRIFQK